MKQNKRIPIAASLMTLAGSGLFSPYSLSTDQAAARVLEEVMVTARR